MVNNKTLGEDIRALRLARKMTLKELAAQLDCSLGWISQVERDLSEPTMEALQKIADVFGVPTSIFFGNADAPERERGRIVRDQARRTIGDNSSGLVESLISPDLTDNFEMIHSTFLPGSSREEVIQRPTQEVAYMVSGKLDLWIDGDAFTLRTGDSFRIRGESYRWANPYKRPAIAVWVISPPVY